MHGDFKMLTRTLVTTDKHTSNADASLTKQLCDYKHNRLVSCLLGEKKYFMWTAITSISTLLIKELLDSQK